MSAGDCFTIEPSLETFWVAENGDVGGGEMWDDGWTVVTKVRLKLLARRAGLLS
jgi:hypothetical protein